MTTFRVSSVDKGTKTFPRTTVQEAFSKRTKAKCEAVFVLARNAVHVSGSDNRFLAAVHTAYSQHYPLVLTPDVIWMCIAQGFAQHVNLNAENLRHLFVEHEGKKKLTVRRDDFVKGSPSNRWPEVFNDFATQIRAAVGEKVFGALTPTFSTTGAVERAAAQLVVMDTFKEYFEYRVCTLCGIPEITLEGTVADWTALKEKALSLGEFDLTWWIDELVPVLDQFVKAASGRVDQEFWSSIYKLNNSSGGPYISGWIATFYPYMVGGEKNSCMALWKCGSLGPFEGLTTDSFLPGLSSTPFVWDYLGAEYPMNFYSGFMAVSQDPSSLALRPEIGWAVTDDIGERAKVKESKPRW